MPVGTEMSKNEVRSSMVFGRNDYSGAPPLRLIAIVEKVHHLTLERGSNRCAGGSVTVYPHVQIAPDLIEVRATEEKPPIFKISSVRPLNSELPMHRIDHTLRVRRVEQGVFGCARRGGIEPPGFVVEVYRTSAGVIEGRKERFYGEPSPRSGTARSISGKTFTT